MSSQQKHFRNEAVEKATNLFRYLAEVKAIQSPNTKELTKYDKVIWLSDIPPEDSLCYCQAWSLFDQKYEAKESGAWIRVRKPKLSPPPKLPEGLEAFVNLQEYPDSSLEEPSLEQDPLREKLIRQFLPDQDCRPGVEVLNLEEHEDVFDEFARYFDKEWLPWAKSTRQDDDTMASPPAIPALIRPWVEEDQLKDYTLDLDISGQISVDRKLEKATKILADQWRRYLDEKWRPWAKLDRRLQKVQKIYNDLYVTYQAYQRLGEQYEVIIGFGLLRWPSASAGKIERHVLVCDVSLSFDPGVGELSVSGNPNGLQLRAETDMLEPGDRPQRLEMEGIEKEIRAIGEEVWDQAFLRHMPQAFVNALSDVSGKFEFSLSRNPLDGNTPQVDLAPALILRRRSQRGYVRLLNEMETCIGKSQDVPVGIREIIDQEAAEAARKERLEAARQTQAELDAFQQESEFQSFEGRLNPLRESEIYFPLPANKEQFEIAFRLQYGRGVLVQGPPGTGKTHTIANLICHLLATGSRVLVTSETPRGLQGLRDKLKGPAKPLAGLCVLLLGDDAGSIKSLEQSVQAINSKLASFDAGTAKKRTHALKEKLLRVRSEKREAEKDLISFREKDTYVHTNGFGNYRGTLQTIVKDVASDAMTYGWLLDDVESSINVNDIFVADAESFIREWVGSSAPANWCDLEVSRPVDLDLLPSAESFATMIGELRSKEQNIEEARNLADSEISTAAKDCSRQSVRALATSLNEILAGLRQLEGHVYAWAKQVGEDVVSDQDQKWRELLRITENEIAKCAERIDDVAFAHIDGILESDVRKFLGFVHILIEHVENGNKLKKKIFQSKSIKEALKAIKKVRVDGHAVETKDDLHRLNSWLIANDVLLNLKHHWGPLAPSGEGPISLQLVEYNNWIEPLRLAVNLHSYVADTQHHIDTIKLPKLPVLHSVHDLKSYICALDIQDEIDCLSNLQGEIEDAQKAALAALRDHRDFELAISEAFSNQDAAQYTATVEEILEFNREVASRDRLLNTARSVKRIFPKTFASLSEARELETWLSRFKDLQAAIEWKRASSKLSDLCRPDHTEVVNKRIFDLQKEEQRLLGELAAEKAWYWCLSKFTEIHRQSLVAWRQAISKIGKGTGKHAALHRATAREELKRCQPAIPAWVMPLHRVVDSVSANSGQFDVAIIDEASQSGPEAIILNYIAKKVVVVGDDKQIRPLNVGANQADVEQLRRQYIEDIEHSESFDLNSSYFSQAELRFSDNIRLKEHFRCMPEIILFSNNHFYSGDPLIPLRQFGGKRLRPVVSAEYVEGGFVKGEGTRRLNEPEARRIVELISKRCADPKYDGMSMGVICLTGGQQDQLIQQLLIGEIGAAEIERRDLLVGRPYTFQGDERDIIFLSMVNVPPDGAGRCRKVTNESKRREFNVAASRACNQLVLVVSFINKFTNN